MRKRLWAKIVTVMIVLVSTLSVFVGCGDNRPSEYDLEFYENWTVIFEDSRATPSYYEVNRKELPSSISDYVVFTYDWEKEKKYVDSYGTESCDPCVPKCRLVHKDKGEYFIVKSQGWYMFENDTGDYSQSCPSPQWEGKYIVKYNVYEEVDGKLEYMRHLGEIKVNIE